jgi:hypothetical protein
MCEVIANSWDDLNAYLWERSFDSASSKWRPYTAFRGLVPLPRNSYTPQAVKGLPA